MANGETIEERILKLKAEALLARHNLPHSGPALTELFSDAEVQISEIEDHLKVNLHEFTETLEDKLGELGGIVEDSVQKHPLISLVAAIGIGIIIGRLSKSQE